MQLGVIIAVLLVIIAIFLWFKSSNWGKVEGEITRFDLIEEYESANSGMSDHERLFRYKVNIEYTYSYDGKQFVGTQIYPGLPNIFPSEKSAREAIDSLRSGSLVTVFFDKSNPKQSALITSKQFKSSALVVMIISILSVVIFVVGGIYIFNKL